MEFYKAHKNVIIALLIVFGAISAIISYNYMKYDNSQDIKCSYKSNSMNKTFHNKNTNEKDIVKPKTLEYIDIYICGSVKRPGVYRLEEKSIINDLIKKAGGITNNADLNKVNLARCVIKGEKIYIPYKGEKEDEIQKLNGDTTLDKTESQTQISSDNRNEGEEAATTNTAKVNINTATSEQLQAVPGIGPTKAKAIIDYRNAKGNFKTIDELDNVNRIGKKTIENWKAYICTN